MRQKSRNRRSAIAIVFTISVLAAAPLALADGYALSPVQQRSASGANQEAVSIGEAGSFSQIDLFSRVTAFVTERLLRFAQGPCKGNCINVKEPDDNPLFETVDTIDGDLPGDWGPATP